jgi:phospholipase/carboxylesterase
MTESSLKITNSHTFNPSGDAPDSVAILLHGLGSNGQDLISLAPYWARAIPNTVFVSPDAPFACDMVPEGYPNAYQWFSLQTRDPADILAGIQTAAPILDAFIAETQEKYNVEADKIALIGFSQGTMMSLYSAPRYNARLAGVLGYSGALYWDHETDASALKKIPIHLIHGEDDDVVPCEAWSSAREILKANDFPVSGETTPGLAHNIDEKGIQSGGDFLRAVLCT